MVNREYGKLIDGRLKYANNPLVTKDGTQIGNPTAEQYLAEGYKYIIYTDMPSMEGYYYTPFYTETDTEIVQNWEEHLIPEPTEE